MASDVEVWIDWRGLRRVGLFRRSPGSGRERVAFTYDPAWLDDGNAFPLTPDLPLGRGGYTPPAGQDMIPALGDSAPDRWGRNVMIRLEGRKARAEGRKERGFHETDFLLGVNDETRLGAMRFKVGEVFQSPEGIGVPVMVNLGKLLAAAQRVLRGEETYEDLQMLFAPGSSLGGARPKASVRDNNGLMSIAKFPKDDDHYSVERWEAIALEMAGEAGIRTASHELHHVEDKIVFLSHRFDRDKHGGRIPFVSALAMLNGRDGEQYSYIELADIIASESVNPESDWQELFRRVVFSILIKNADDHMRNHGFLRTAGGWRLSPAYDINPEPNSFILRSYVSEDNADASIELLRDSAEDYMVERSRADEIIAEVASVTCRWREYAQRFQTPASEIDRMAGSFEHEELERALT